MKTLMLAALVVVIGGCATRLTPAMEAVRSTDGKGCEFITSDSFEVQPFNISRYLKARTHNLGGNAYKLIDTTETGFGTLVNSEVYKCDFESNTTE